MSQTSNLLMAGNAVHLTLRLLPSSADNLAKLFDALMKEFLGEKNDIEKNSADDKKYEKLPSMKRVKHFIDLICNMYGVYRYHVCLLKFLIDPDIGEIDGK